MAAKVLHSREQMVLNVHPQDISFPGNGMTHTEAQINLHNPTNKRVAFKVKTTAPRRYCVRPNSGIIDPDSTMSIQVLFQPGDANSLNDIPRHKFLVQAIVLNDNEDTTNDTKWRDITTNQHERLMESKMRVLFPDLENIHTTHAAHEPATDGTVDVKMLVEEVRKLREQIKNQSDENNILKSNNTELRSRIRASTGSHGIASLEGPMSIKTAFLNIQVQLVMLILFIIGLLSGKYIF